MLLEVLGLALFFLAGAAIVAKGALGVLRRLDLDPMTLMLFFGIAEHPLSQPRRGRRRLAES